MPDDMPTGDGDIGGLENVEGVSGDDLGLAPDVYGDSTPETSPVPAEDGSDGELSPTGEDQDVASDATEGATQDPEAQPSMDGAQEGEPTFDNEDVFYRYGQTEFKDPESLDNFIRSSEGRLRKANYDFNDAMAKNTAWQNWANDPAKIREHLAKLEGTTPEKVTTTTGEQKKFLNDTDWKALASLVQQGRGMEALAAMADMYDQVMDSRLAELEGKFDQAVQPIQQRNEAVTYTTNLMKAAANAMDQSGNYIWPEFNRQSGSFDPQFCQLFTRVWNDLPANVAWDENLHGIEIAYNRTRQLYANNPQLRGEEAQQANDDTTGNANAGTSEAANRAANMARDAQGRFLKQTEDASTAVGGSGGNPPPAKGPATSFSDAAILRGMDQANDDRDPMFGIRR